MKTPEDLKTELFRKLKQSPAIEAFLGDSLRTRVGLDDTWIENPLVVYVLDEVFKQDPTLPTWIETLASCRADYDILRKRLPFNGDYDGKILDFLAEVGAYCAIKDSGFTEVRAIQETDGKKTPDFSAKFQQGRYLFEVKNMRPPADVQDFLWDKTTARRLRFPEEYNRLQLNIQVSRAWEEIRFAKDVCLKSKLLAWLEDFFASIEGGEKLDVLSKRRFIAGKESELWIECDLEEGHRFVSTGFSRAQLLDKDRKRELPPFLSAAVRVVNGAMEQLFEYDQNDEYQKYILLNRSIRKSFLLLESEARDIVKGLDNIVKRINDSVFVKWLHQDNLP